MHVKPRLLVIACLAIAGLGTPAAASAAPETVAMRAFVKAVEDAKAAMMADPEHALMKSEIARTRAAQLPPSTEATVAMMTANWLKAEAYIGLNRPDAAVPIVNQTLKIVEQVAPRSKLRGDLLRSRGAISAMSGHIQDSLSDFHLAYEVFGAAGVARSQALTLHDIGQIYWDAGDYPRVLQYYSQAAEMFSGDPTFILTSHNTRGEVLRKLGRPKEAEAEYTIALKNARLVKSPLLQVRVLSNLAAAQVEVGDPASATRSINEALNLARADEAAGERPFLLGAEAKIAMARGDMQRAAALLQQTFAGADLTKTQMPFREFHQMAATAYADTGQSALAYEHLKAFQRLDSDARKLTASTSAQLMSAKFDFNNQNLKISQLKQARLAADIEFRTILFSGLAVAAAVVFGLLLFGFISIRRSRNEVRVANTVLTNVNEKLEKALNAKTEFLAMTSHEIRTPLNGILGMTQILLANRSVAGQMREQIEVVHGAGESMKALVDDILDVAKMEKGEVATLREPVDVRSVLQDAARLWGGHASAKNLSLQVNIADAPPQIVTDRTRLKQILSNLLSNAVKFTPAGVIGLYACVDQSGDRPMFVVEVTDTGVGIPEDQQALVFEAFHQVDGGTTRQFSGTGLGLAICRNLATTLGGTLEMRSSVGVGSTFTVRLPMVAEMPGAADITAVAVRTRPTRLDGATLLVVEQNGLTQGVLRTLLAPAAGAVQCAASGDAALAALNAGAIDHMLIEPKSAAFDDEGDVCASLRRLIEAADTRGISTSLLFAASEDLPIDRLAQLGASQIVLKPVSGAQLIAALRECYAASAADRHQPDDVAQAA